ncbi:hypothetical protein [Streptomyces sp. NBC_00454]|uniref:hypothetical protein n=1 Tax=Streptomyces sp. NBC_00454 TaxID=2975747 RepID=UPI002F9182EE
MYYRFEDKEQLITALTERMLERREEYVAEQLLAAEPLLSGVMDAYAHALLQPSSATAPPRPGARRTAPTPTGSPQ